MTGHRSAYDFGTERTIRGRIRAAGYHTSQVVSGLAWAQEQGFTTLDQGYERAMSRILFSDDDLAQGIRWKG